MIIPLARRAHRLTIVVASVIAIPAMAGPVDFGRAELGRAAAEHGLAALSIRTEITTGPAESFSITPDMITGADERGLMYGLLEVAEQIRRNGKIVATQGKPATPMRGIRYFIHNEAMENAWYYSPEYWDAYFSMLAKNRLNRFNLVFAHETNYLAPPYPFWVDVPEFPEIRVPGLSASQRGKNLKMLCAISQAAADHGIDFTLGIWEHNAWGGLPPSTRIPPVEGLNDNTLGPYSYAALKQVLQACSAIRSVQVRTNEESGIPSDKQLVFYRDWVFRAIHDVGRPVTLDMRGHEVWSSDMLEAAEQSGVPLRLSAKHWLEMMGRPYQPVETLLNYSYMNFLKKPRPYGFYWEVWSLGSHRLLLWGDPDHVRRAVPTFSLSDSMGFEIDAPMAQKGFGNSPGDYGIFEQNQYLSHEDRKFWRWEFERYWLFYLLWGRLSYDPGTSSEVWMSALQERFGNAAQDVIDAYASASKVLTEIIAARAADYSQTTWPEINPGELIAGYKDDLPSDTAFVASPSEAAHNVVHKISSAKQRPRDTAQLLDGIAAQIDSAVARASSKLGEENKEWRGTQPDFQVLSLLARYHARKQEAAYSLSWFYETGSLAALDHTEADLVKALDIWKRLVSLTDGLYPRQMVYGPSEFGHWKDKLPYVYHDVAWVRELKRTQHRYGNYGFRFQFCAHAPSTNLGSPWNEVPFISLNAIEPRFTPVDPQTMYSEPLGYGWYGGGALPFTAMVDAPLTPSNEIRALIAQPRQLPENVLFSSYLRVPQRANFRVRTGAGTFEVVMLYSDTSEFKQTLSAHDGVVDITFPANRSYNISGLLLRNVTRTPGSPIDDYYPPALPRPQIIHTPPSFTTVGQPLDLTVTVDPSERVTGIRLHYRPLNAMAPIRTLEVKGSRASFTIPGADIAGDFDLLYYFEVLNSEHTGWFQPDPAVTTPYYIVTVRKAAH
jgi:hypothetical protein